PPFSGSAIEIAIANINNEPPAIAARTGVVVPPIMEAFARKLMARRPGDRFATAQAALDVLALVGSDPELAYLKMGRMDVARALRGRGRPGVGWGRRGSSRARLCRHLPWRGGCPSGCDAHPTAPILVRRGGRSRFPRAADAHRHRDGAAPRVAAGDRRSGRSL